MRAESKYQKKSKLAKPLSVVFTIVLIPVGIYYMCFLYSVYEKSNDAKSWDKVSCKVIRSKLLTSQLSGGAKAPPVPSYDLNILYEYTYNEKDYTSALYKFGGNNFKDTDTANSAQNNHQENHFSNCYVNPRNPSEAVIERDFPLKWGTILLILLFPVAAVISLCITIGIFLEKDHSHSNQQSF